MNPVRLALERFELTNRRHHLLQKGDRVLVAVSGGSDSMALLGLLLVLQKKYSLRIAAAHLHHGLQKDGDKALRLVERTCRAKSVLFYFEKKNVAALAKRKRLSLEDAGRQARYEFFVRAARKSKADVIATAHTLDDQAETVLMRVLRGSGTKGLAGIPYSRQESGRCLIRPLLDLRKKELLAVARSLEMPFLDDKMNRDPRFLRNRVRHDLLPQLRRYNPRIDEALADLQAVHTDLRTYLQKPLAESYRRVVAHTPKNGLRLKISALKKLPPALRNETILEALSRLKGDMSGFGHTHVRSILDLMDKVSGETHLPHGIRVAKKSAYLSLSPKRS